jgi:hypothetical protein
MGKEREGFRIEGKEALSDYCMRKVTLRLQSARVARDIYLYNDGWAQWK